MPANPGGGFGDGGIGPSATEPDRTADLLARLDRHVTRIEDERDALVAERDRLREALAEREAQDVKWRHHAAGHWGPLADCDICAAIAPPPPPQEGT